MLGFVEGVLEGQSLRPSAARPRLFLPQLPHQYLQAYFHGIPSGIKIILVTHPRTGDLRESLKYIYNLYVEYVVKNPLYTSGTPIRVKYIVSGDIEECRMWKGLRPGVVFKRLPALSRPIAT